MAIERIAISTPTAPIALADYQSILAQLLANGQAFTSRLIVEGSTIKAGTVILIGGVLYKATSDTAISGSASAYVKVTPAGATATAAFVANLTGVTWNDAYGGYYDGTGNLHVFDEAKAAIAGEISTVHTLEGKLGFIFGNLVVSGNLSAVGLALTGALTGATSITSSGAVSGASVSATGSFGGASGTQNIDAAGDQNVRDLALGERISVTWVSSINRRLFLPFASGRTYIVESTDTANNYTGDGIRSSNDQIYSHSTGGTMTVRIIRVY